MNYPNYSNTPVVDFIVAFAQLVFNEFDQLAPSSNLESLNRLASNTQVKLFNDVNEMIEMVVAEARIRNVDCSRFSGSTLDEVIQFVVNSQLV